MQDATGTPCAVIDIGAYEYPGQVNNCNVSETLQSSLNPSFPGQNVVFTAQLASSVGTPTGNVQFSDGASVLSTQPVSTTGTSTYSTSSLAIGTHPITAVYQPAGAFAAATASLSQVVSGYATSTALSCFPNPIYAYNTAQLTATVTSSAGTPTGSIAFSDNGAALATQSLAGGTTSLAYTGLVSGTHTLTATYLPSGSFAGGSASCSEVVTPLPTIATLSVTPAAATYGSAITLSVTVRPATPPGPGAPTGTVTFLNGASVLGTGTLTNGASAITTGALPGGMDRLTCVYNGSSTYATSLCNTVPITITAAASTLTLTSSLNPAPALNPVVFTVHLTYGGQPAPAGNIVMLGLNGQTVQLTTDVTGSATYSIATLAPGTYPVTAAFFETASLLASSASLTQVITALPTSTTITVVPNPAYLSQPVTITASVTATGASVNSGTITFFDNTAPLATQPVASGTAVYTTSTLAVGTHPITAAYNPPGPSLVTSSSPTLNEVILPSGFTLALLPASITLPPGATGSVAVQLTSVGNFAGPLTLTYGATPAYATASISPSTVNLTAGGTAASTLTLQTLVKASNDVPQKPGSSRVPIVFAACLLMLSTCRSARRRLPRVLSVLLLLLSLQALSGCTNSWYIANHVAPGTYQVSVTGSDQLGNTQTAVLTVIVTP